MHYRGKELQKNHVAWKFRQRQKLDGGKAGKENRLSGYLSGSGMLAAGLDIPAGGGVV